jgi:hypothetical protein
MESEECPVCLEPLDGTVVHLGCCKNKLHIQCYLNKCPFCRADLPSPHVVVPVPVGVETRRELDWKQKLLPTTFTIIALLGFISIMTFTQR